MHCKRDDCTPTGLPIQTYTILPYPLILPVVLAKSWLLSQIMTPVVKLLRLMDGEKPAMGKIYDRMFMIGEKIEASDVSWKAKAVKIHAERWEYLHSEMHAAGYALDPEFIKLAKDVDEATQNGLTNVIEKVSTSFRE